MFTWVRGRICADRDKLLATIEFFREFCREHHCLERAYSFASDLSRAGRDLAKGYLQSETPFVWNATNIVKPIRSGLIRLFAGYRARIRIVYLEVPIDRLLQQNRTRKAQVPTAVIHRYRDRLEIPDLTEAHQLDCFVAL